MAQAMNLKPFYLGFATLVLIGIGVIWLARSSGGEPVDVGPVPLNAAGFPGYVLGSDSAPVEIIEYADFGCSACAVFTVLAGQDMKSRLISAGRVRWRFRDFVGPSHQNSLDAHLAGACAGEQGQFWPMHDQIMFNQQRWMRERNPAREFRDYARTVGIDVRRYDACVSSRSKLGQLDASKQEGLDIGVTATPSFVIDGKLYEGALPYDSLVTLVEQAEVAARQ